MDSTEKVLEIVKLALRNAAPEDQGTAKKMRHFPMKAKVLTMSNVWEFDKLVKMQTITFEIS